MNLPKGKNVGGWEETVVLAGDYYGDWAFDGGREPRVGDRIVFRDMIHYTMVKTTMFNGVTHPSIGIWNPETGFRLSVNSVTKIIKTGCLDRKIFAEEVA